MEQLNIRDNADCDKIIDLLGRNGLRYNLRELHDLHALLRQMCAEVARITVQRHVTASEVLAFLKGIEEPKGNGFTSCRQCGESIIGTPDGAVCLGGHPQ